ncbi:MAG TPA: hypothetical protein VKH19_03945 [Gemmatimonadaceae bacterium]|nr:hypothetical protein [Gemmatimonadaceae bacterium]
MSRKPLPPRLSVTIDQLVVRGIGARSAARIVDGIRHQLERKDLPLATDNAASLRASAEAAIQRGAARAVRGTPR